MMDDKELEEKARTWLKAAGMGDWTEPHVRAMTALLREVADEARREALEQVAERDVALDKAVLRVAELERERDEARADWVALVDDNAATEAKLAEVQAEGSEKLAAAEALRGALEALVMKIDEVHAHPDYKAVWVLSHVHGVEYKGPSYGPELDAAIAVLRT